MTSTFDLMFFTAWGFIGAYIVLGWATAFRIGWLHGERRSPEIPSFGAFVLGGFGLTALLFMFSDRHRRIGDPVLSMLVIACRWVFVIALCVLGGLFIRAIVIMD